MDIISKIEKNRLVGRGGASFPAAFKWKAVRDAENETKYIVCNATEGEPGVFKDDYILDNYSDRVIDGIKLALDILGAEKAYIYINRHYYNEYHDKLRKKFRNHSIEFFIKPKGSGYIGGEETSILNAIEGERAEPRIKPPFPPRHGLWGCPTLVHNVETFYDISLLASNEFEGKRFYSVGGDCSYPGVYELSANFTVEKILKETGNYPEYNFFVQVGGGAAGEVFNNSQLKRKVAGAGSIIVYKSDKYKPKKLIHDWLNFFLRESCGKCTPCREGLYRAKEILNSPKPDWHLFCELMNNLDDSSFCGLGKSAFLPFKSYFKNILEDGYVGEQKSDLKMKEVSNCFNK
jgi:NADH:ubiquinone oxidoreductase subunit F (NADH-binding)